ncbi:MAG TPA: hypothetical protein VN457_06795, partial [Chlamydiales bacterium]|nr:hypothetical protein [Chlamydiales bacterium]
SAQRKLAEEVTRFVHGQEGVQAALKVTVGINDATLTGKLLAELAQDMPHAQLAKDELVGQKYIDIAVKVGLLPSKSEGTKLIKNGGAYLNNKKVEDPIYQIASADLIDGSYILLSVGKKKRMLIKMI